MFYWVVRFAAIIFAFNKFLVGNRKCSIVLFCAHTTNNTLRSGGGL